MRKPSTVALLGLLFVGRLFAQEVLTNASIIKLIRSGLSEDMIVNIVKTQPGNYSLGANDIIAFKEAGASEKIINAIVNKAVPLSKPETAELPKDEGVYWRTGVSARGANLEKSSSAWQQLLPEPVNWQTGGVLKAIGTAGIVKGDVNGKVYGRRAKNVVPIPAEVLFRLPEAVEITEYQLIHLHEHRDSREFRTVTGGVFHVSGGARRDLVAFDFKKVADRTYSVQLESLEPGEYGFLAPGAAMQSHASAQLGKMYTFRVPE